ncbi:MAG: RsmE family RNA methyltransferase, partial [Armatimonadetes bacterium]|nr:RsmE family RNA methyltransferase [Armatimonadota bacterium]
MRERAQPRHVFVDTEVPPEGDFAIGGGIRHHLADVLRVRVGDVLIVRSHCGAAHRGEICEIGRKVLSVRILGPVAAPPSPPCDITVAQAPGKGDRFERVLQHGTEIGVARFIPVVSDRTIASRRPNMPTNPSRERPATGHPSGPEWTAKVDRWRAILRSSAEQAQRDRV